MAKDTKKNRELMKNLIKAYPVLEEFSWELEECLHYSEKCKNRNKGKEMCFLCQRNKIGFELKQCHLGTGCYDYDGTKFEDTDPIFNELPELIKSYPELFTILSCDDCCGCAGW